MLTKSSSFIAFIDKIFILVPSEYAVKQTVPRILTAFFLFKTGYYCYVSNKRPSYKGAFIGVWAFNREGRL